ncbi:host-nuclease inhibitor Gam family protein [Heyndrickxia shackletonii]|nr:host-nuclease inhibitor Gam family protein [Heyndrickxia shackletonii]MBB2482343.1 host-nuclease inhibitor Gam family protein [Bacillus sp. APMAM]NEZ02126.1 hypothetical protein [Heyndrickxia shackletonii]RTZ54268.1 hypothetical protein EKO25_18865 [Bacillus sp. SAJ1]
MGTFFALVGFLLIIGAIVYLIVSLIKKNFKKNLLMYIGGAGIILFILGICIPSGSAQTVSIDGKKLDYDKLVAEIKSKKEELNNVKKQLDDLNNQYTEKEDQINAAMDVVNNKKKSEDELKKLQSDIDSKKEEVKSWDSKLNSKKKELASVAGQIQKRKGAPKVLPAGYFSVGKDIPAGRYKVVPNGGMGNFFVNEGAKVNIILGYDASLSVKEYVFDADEGDEIQLTTSAKFIPVK